MLTTAAWPGGTLLPGQEIAVDDDLARALIEGGYAEPVGGAEAPAPPTPETATAEPPEAAVARAPRRRRRRAKRKGDEAGG